MKLSNWMKTLTLGLALLGPAAGCSEDGNNVGVATSREIRGRVPVREGVTRILRVIAVNARTRRAVAQTTPAMDGTFVLRGVTKGAMYRLHAVIGRRSIPIVFPKSRGSMDKTNLFLVGDKDSPRVGALDGPIDVGELRQSSADAFETPPERAPNLQEDFDADGLPDGDDPDRDGDGVPNVTDADQDRDGMPDNVEYGDQDGDGLTNESDPDQDGDGIMNTMDPDDDNDGMTDAMDPTPDGMSGNPADDRDGDGLPNSEDETPNGEDVPVNPDVDAGKPGDASAPEDAGMAEDAGAAEDGGAAEDAGTAQDAGGAFDF